ncbi:MAG: restriction endonuclease, partial [Streptomycetaceae bacterium]|nr:restriction endonuclease [Streptomycetaceae bacterium]
MATPPDAAARPEDWIGLVRNLRRWRRADERAPHKPLLMLYALARFQQGATELPFSTAEVHLRRLLDEFGPPRPTHPGYPFHYLVNDGVWEVRRGDGAPGSPGAEVGKLRAAEAVGSLAADLRADLTADPGLAARLAWTILESAFPPSLHAEICAEVGLDLTPVGPGEAAWPAWSAERRVRDAALRAQVLDAYACACAFCGYDGTLGRVPVGLEAAHVRWWAYDGPDELGNSLCLCSLHHRLLDAGVLGLTGDLRIAVSGSFRGRGPAAARAVADL